MACWSNTFTFPVGLLFSFIHDLTIDQNICFLYSGHEKLIFLDRLNFKPLLEPIFSSEPGEAINIPCKTTHPNVTISLFQIQMNGALLGACERNSEWTPNGKAGIYAEFLGGNSEKLLAKRSERKAHLFTTDTSDRRIYRVTRQLRLFKYVVKMI